MKYQQPSADRTLKQRVWCKSLLSIGGETRMNDEPVGEQSRNVGLNLAYDRLRQIDGQSDASTGLTHQICNERTHTGTQLTHLSGHERNTPQQIAQQVP